MMQVSFNNSAREVNCRSLAEIYSGSAPNSIGQALLQRVENVRQLPTLSESLILERLTQGADPELRNNKATYAQVEGELYGKGGPKLSNIRQGGLGDCYFLAAIGSVVAEDPKLIKDAIRDNKDGTYSFRFYADGPLGSLQPVWVTVDKDLPVDSKGRLAYAKGVDSDDDGKLELWVPLMEKAYAKFKDKYGPEDDIDGYADIGRGGSCRKAIETLTGQSARYEKLPASDAQLQALLSGADSGAQVVVNTKSKGSDGWVGNHAYTVVGTFEQNGEVMVTLRNPWGTTEPDAADKGTSKNNGLFSVSLDELRGHVQGVSSNAAKPASLFSVLFDRFF
jgi:hypothetical protein